MRSSHKRALGNGKRRGEECEGRSLLCECEEADKYDSGEHPNVHTVTAMFTLAASTHRVQRQWHSVAPHGRGLEHELEIHQRRGLLGANALHGGVGGGVNIVWGKV